MARAAAREPDIHRYGADPAQFGELWRPGGVPLGTVVIIHGGFWRARYDLSLGRPLAADLAARGYAAWNLEYRRALAGGGWPGTFEDVAAGIDLLATLPADTSRVVAVGHSAGGHLAAWAAGRAKLPPNAPGAPGADGRAFVAVTGVVSQAGVLALADCARERVGDTAALDLMGGGPGDLPREYRLADPIAAVPVPAPVLCLHSRGDAHVPYSYSERYVAAATAAGGTASLTELAGDHFTLIDPATPDWAAVIAALPAFFSLRSVAGNVARMDPLTLAVATSAVGKVTETLTEQGQRAVALIVSKLRDKFAGRPAEAAVLDAAIQEPAPDGSFAVESLARALEREFAADAQFRAEISALWQQVEQASTGTRNVFRGRAQKVVQIGGDLHGDLTIS
jgi:acetyl esterase/lipase